MAFINLGQVIYPIGAIYASTNSTSPANLFGGTWSQITGDACLMAGSSFGNVGSKKISVSQMPSHEHDVRCSNRGGNTVALVDWQTNADQGGVWFLGCADRDLNSPYRYRAWSVGGGKIICLTLTVVTCGGEPRKSSDALCVI